MKFTAKTTILNILFLLVGAAILLFLLKAPEETTSRLPMDDTHRKFQSGISKKAAEKQCGQCHGPGGEAQLPPDHPPPYRCLFCHKRQI
ncbi:hypothetical protein JWG42_02115 [Desulfoprunum benzoelyticum]|uniref:Cytochrome c553 n=1 Tax=Desulfoprunum benzoelyticum TaxID=1506996 RepID=A0A840UPP4_9BACT|nr:hypothetical protein [Desulfoprunum benzoelyticum]MBB5346523.1 cytochrome c553 [Desulfoprunum benzoelyticum]MBM9528948.1 hypothetical protein [Desulfoprunum benzoelyticum]